MSNKSKETDASLPLLERILIRLNSIESHIDKLDARLNVLEETAERRAMETKQVWELALAEIMVTQEAVRVVESKLDVMNKELFSVKAEQSRQTTRLEDLEGKPN